ncbi:MAG: nitroreductase family protein [Candidatus Bathyarchaeota archaeon]
MDVFETIRGRRSIRSYKSDPVPQEVLNRVLDAARWAPSAGNRQSWEFIIVSDPPIKRYLRDAALGQSFIEEAPIVVVVCANELRSARLYGNRGRIFYCLLDGGAAAQNMLLAAYALGLGACWIGAFDDEMVVKILNLPFGIRPVAIIPLGYPYEVPKPPPRMELNELVHLNRC